VFGKKFFEKIAHPGLPEMLLLGATVPLKRGNIAPLTHPPFRRPPSLKNIAY